MYGSDTLIDLTSDTVDSSSMLSGVTAHAASGEIVTGNIQEKSASDVTGSGSTVTVQAGYYRSNITRTLQDMGMRTIYYDTTANWNLQSSLVSERGSVYVYSDHQQIDDGNGNITYIPGIKVGDGSAYVVDLPFDTDLIVSQLNNHVSNTTIHITSSERTFWNGKVSATIDANDSEYNFKDAQARQDISNIQTSISGGVVFKGETTTQLTNGATTATIVINSANVTATQGMLVVYGNKEFVFDGTQWIEMGDLSVLGALAYKDSASATYTPAGTVSQPTFSGSSSSVSITAQANASGNYTPAGSVSQPTFSGSSLTSTGKFTPSGSVGLTTTNTTSTVSKAESGDTTYTPEGSVSAPTISVSTAGTTTTVNSITAVGTLPSLSATVSDENLTLSWDAGTLPTKGSNTTVKTGDASYTASTPTFTGTGARLVTGNIAVPTSASFTGTEGDLSVSGTPAGTVSQPTFTGTSVQLAGSTTASGTVSQPTFSGTQATITSS